MKAGLIKLITLYQALLSPDHSFWAKHRFPYGYCRFHPSCSEYLKQAILKYGPVPGLLKGSRRVLRCNPFTAPQVDNA